MWAISYSNLNFKVFNSLYNSSTASILSRDVMECWARGGCVFVFLVKKSDSAWEKLIEVSYDQ